MQKIGPSSEDSSGEDCNSDRITACSTTTTESPAINQSNTDRSTARGSSTDRIAEARGIIATNSNAEYSTAGTSSSRI